MKRKIMRISVLLMLTAGLLCGCSSMQGMDKELADILIQIVTGSGSDTTDTEQVSNRTTERTTNRTTEQETETKTTAETEDKTEASTEATTEVTTAATTETAKVEAPWKEAYIAKLKEMESFGSPLRTVALIDMNQDGTPELLASTISAGGDMYTYADGQVVSLQYLAADGANLYYRYQEDYLIAVSIGGDCMSGRSVAFSTMHGNMLGQTEYEFTWDDDMNPLVLVHQSSGSYTPTYEEACEDFANWGVYVSYTQRMDYAPFLDYTITVDNPEVYTWGDINEAEAGIRAW